jgi:hypothetical protein
LARLLELRLALLLQLRLVLWLKLWLGRLLELRLALWLKLRLALLLELRRRLLHLLRSWLLLLHLRRRRPWCLLRPFLGWAVRLARWTGGPGRSADRASQCDGHQARDGVPRMPPAGSGTRPRLNHHNVPTRRPLGSLSAP